MGVDYRIAKFYGVKLLEDEFDGDTFEALDSREDYSTCYLSDCYSGEWLLIGKLIEMTESSRYEGDADFWFDSKVSKKDKEDARRILEEFNIDKKPELHIFSYWS